MRILFFIAFTSVILAVALNVSAIAVVSDFLENNTLYLYEGEHKLYRIALQNSDDFDANFKVTYDNTNAKIIDYQEVYTVPPKTNYPIFFNVSAEDKEPGENFIVSFTVHQLEGTGEGVPILLKINKNFRVKVLDDPQRTNIKWEYVIYPAIAIAMVLYFLYKKKEKENNGGKKQAIQKHPRNRKIVK